MPTFGWATQPIKFDGNIACSDGRLLTHVKPFPSASASASARDPVVGCHFARFDSVCRMDSSGLLRRLTTPVQPCGHKMSELRQKRLPASLRARSPHGGTASRGHLTHFSSLLVTIWLGQLKGYTTDGLKQHSTPPLHGHQRIRRPVRHASRRPTLAL